MRHRLLRRRTLLPSHLLHTPYFMVILQQTRQQVQRIRRAFLPILRGEENRPRLPRVIGYGPIIHYGHVQTVPVAVLSEILRTQHFADF